MKSKQLTGQLAKKDRRTVVDYFSAHPRVDVWNKIAGVVVGPAGLTLITAVTAAHHGKWPVIEENGDYEIPDHLQVGRALRWAGDLFNNPKSPFFPNGGSPTVVDDVVAGIKAQRAMRPVASGS